MIASSFHIEDFKRVYFIGIGGIGMSALARYFALQGLEVAGYDKTPSPLTDELISEGIAVHFEDLGANLPEPFNGVSQTLVVYTPAIPSSLGELQHVQSAGYVVMKRAQVLGLITRSSNGLGVAGTHGKTTTSTMLAYLLSQSSVGCNAFLGGISSNFNSNFVSHPTSDYTVIEADEFDRSFLQLSPVGTIITSMDADHLDIYGDEETFAVGFRKYLQCLQPGGFAVIQADVPLRADHTITYGVEKPADVRGEELRYSNGQFTMNVVFAGERWENVVLGIPGIHNAENALACIAMARELGLSQDEIRAGLASFRGVKRRFEYQIRSEKLVYIDDYAHHPTEIKALIDSVQLLYPGQKITGIFQPHLFSRTRDFFDGFAEQLSRLDECILLPIYPARELPIAGVTSDALLEKITSKEKGVVERDAVVGKLTGSNEGVFLTIGAGDIDRIVPLLKQELSS